ncbi:elongation factor 2 [Vairimorpha necatrix]|uniref:Elongation factor 2 n=1 Tax=Vairimorpha necatrix TaxID=6039 RepID=A0AAX4J8N6_9MICR
MEKDKVIITSVIAHIDHGKTTLIDSLVAHKGKLSKSLAGEMRYMDTREDEQKRGITLKLSALSIKQDIIEHLILDTPGHVDFEFLVESSSLLSDCFLIVIDIVEGITPRTYSLINYIRNKYTVLIINKIDKIETYDEAIEKIEKILLFLNSMVGEKIFTWENNNIILSSATFCYGISFKSSLNILKKNFTDIETTTKFIYFLEEQIKNKKYEKICTRFNILKPTRKNILSTIMPLSTTIFDCIEHVYEPNTFKKYLFDSSVPLKLNEPIENQTVCFVSLGILEKPHVYEKDNLIFITRIFQGKISKNENFYSEHGLIKIRKIFKFKINEFEEVEEVSGSNLICIKADIKKNTPFFSDKLINFTHSEKIHPFYKSILVPENKDQMEELKDILRVLVHTEQCLKIKINKYNEIDILSAGKVQVEKMIEDLKFREISVQRSVDENLFCEYPKGRGIYNFENENFKIKIQVYKNEDIEYKDYIDEFNNRFVVHTNKFKALVLSILEIYTLEGPMISEYIRDTTFVVDLEIKNDLLDEDDLYSQIKSQIKNAYFEAEPSVAPFFYKLKISIQDEFLGNIYNKLQKFHNLILSEDYDEIMSFYVLSILIPHFEYDDFIEEVRICTKGTAYILSSEFGYFYDLDFSESILELRKTKGLLTDEKIIINPEKQRTLKK